MATQITFFQGGGSQEDYEADEKLVASLKQELGPGYVVHYPVLPNDGSPDLGRRGQINGEISAMEDGGILIGHSLGASMLLVCLSENEPKRKIGGIFLIATPFWKGTEGWVDAFRLRPDFAEKLDPRIPLFFYHCRDDDEVPFTQLATYKQHLPSATFREIPRGGHQLGNDLAIVAADIKSLSRYNFTPFNSF